MQKKRRTTIFFVWFPMTSYDFPMIFPYDLWILQVWGAWERWTTFAHSHIDPGHRSNLKRKQSIKLLKVSFKYISIIKCPKMTIIIFSYDFLMIFLWKQVCNCEHRSELSEHRSELSGPPSSRSRNIGMKRWIPKLDKKY